MVGEDDESGSEWLGITRSIIPESLPEGDSGGLIGAVSRPLAVSDRGALRVVTSSIVQ